MSWLKYPPIPLQNALKCSYICGTKLDAVGLYQVALLGDVVVGIDLCQASHSPHLGRLDTENQVNASTCTKK